MAVYHVKDTPSLDEWDDQAASLYDLAQGATTQFWGGPFDAHDHGTYTDGLLCPLCGMVGDVTPITNGSKLCKQHRVEVNAKTQRDVQRCVRAARKRKKERERRDAKDNRS